MAKQWKSMTAPVWIAKPITNTKIRLETTLFTIPEYLDFGPYIVDMYGTKVKSFADPKARGRIRQVLKSHSYKNTVITLAGEIDPYEWMRGIYRLDILVRCYTGKKYMLLGCRPLEMLKGVDQYLLINHTGCIIMGDLS